MIYVGLTQAEIQKLEPLLTEIGIPFEIHINGEKLDTKQPRTGASVFEVEIDDEVLKTIPQEYHARLERFGIHPHSEMTEDFMKAFSEPSKAEKEREAALSKPKAAGWKKWISWQGIVLVILAALYIKKRMHW